MGYTRRIQAAGIYHVMTHAVANTALYHDDIDRWDRLNRIAELAKEGVVECLAFSIMGNHEHLLILVAEGQLPKVMHRLNRGYARAFNKRHGRKGRLYSGPYVSIPVDTQEYLFEVLRYIALNAEVVGRGSAEEYIWCSHPGLVGLRPQFGFVNEGRLLDMVGGANHQRARERVALLVEDGRLRNLKRAA